MQYTWQLALVLVYFIKHSVSCYIYYIHVHIRMHKKDNRIQLCTMQFSSPDQNEFKICVKHGQQILIIRTILD